MKIKRGVRTQKLLPISSLEKKLRSQLICRRALVKKLKRDKYRLKHLQDDTRVLGMLVHPGETERLTEEIETLRGECDVLSETLEKFGVVVDLSSRMKGKKSLFCQKVRITDLK